MQIVINVDNELYEYFSKRRTMNDDGYFSHVGKLIKALRNGLLLPKEHGRLIDADLLRNQFPIWIDNFSSTVVNNTISKLPTIIEADKAEK